MFQQFGVRPGFDDLTLMAGRADYKERLILGEAVWKRPSNFLN